MNKEELERDVRKLLNVIGRSATILNEEAQQAHEYSAEVVAEANRIIEEVNRLLVALDEGKTDA